MRISLVQHSIEWMDTRKNLERLRKRITGIPQTDIIILAEDFTTGFSTEGDFSEQDSRLALEWMKEMAVLKDAAITGSVAFKEDGRLYNRLFFVTPDGSVFKYDKRHLFTFAHEDEYVTAGKERVIVEYKGMRILLQTCYDLRFPCFMRNHGDYDMMILVASWPVTRQKPWEILVKARAIENQCFVAAVNRVGEDPNCSYAGGSQLIDAKGKTLARARSRREQVLSVEISKESLDKFRKKFPVLRDADETTVRI